MQLNCTTVAISETKVCTRCKTEQPIDNFCKDKKSKDGHFYYCKQCRREYHLSHQSERNEYARQFYWANWERERAKNREYQIEHSEYISAKNRAYQQTHKERENERGRARRQANPWLHRIAKANKSATKVSAEGRFTVDEFKALCDAKGWVCSYCGKQLTEQTVSPDHIIPLTRGGSNYIANINPSCRFCNRTKQNKTPEEWLASKKG